MHSEHDERSGERSDAAPSADPVSRDDSSGAPLAAADDKDENIPELGVEHAVWSGDFAATVRAGGTAELEPTERALETQHAAADATADSPPSFATAAQPETETQLESEPQPQADAAPQRDDDADPTADLSPAVRRLVRQYDLDVTGIHGTGPSGRIRVGDVIAVLGGRAEQQPRAGEPTRAGRAAEEAEDAPRETASRSTPRAEPAGAGEVATSVFECDLTRVLLHRKQCSERKIEVALTSYYLLACREALRAVPEAAPRGASLGVAVSAADGQVRNVVVDFDDDSPLGSLNDRLLEYDRALRSRNARADLSRASLVLHHHGLAGSLLATPTPILEGHAASIGLGRARKQIVVRSVDGEDTPRIAALCYVTLSYRTDLLDLPRANRFLAQLVRVLEQWPE